MITRKEFQLQVCDGPSKLDLLTSFATAMAKKPNQPFRVTFEVQPNQMVPQLVTSTRGYKFQAVIHSITHEDSSGESFNLSGTLYDNHNGQLNCYIQSNFTGYYHANSRKGVLNFARDYASDRQ